MGRTNVERQRGRSRLSSGKPCSEPPTRTSTSLIALAVVTLLAIAQGGCASAPDLVKKRASHDLACSAEKLEVREIQHETYAADFRLVDTSGFLATGCDQSEVYVMTGEWGSRWATPCRPLPDGGWDFDTSSKQCAAIRGKADRPARDHPRQ
jgi:hypothetical protein